MKLENQCVALEYAKRLKELGVNQISIFKWIKANHPTEKTCDAMVQHSGALEDSYEETPVTDGWTLTSWAAFTTSELGEMLPRLVMNDDVGYFLEIYRDCDENWSVVYKGFLGSKLTHEYSQSEANCRAKMLIYLIENGLVKV